MQPLDHPNTNLARPIDLCPEGNAAYDRLMKYLIDNDLTDACGKVFYSPTEWVARGEAYGADSILIIVLEGGNHAAAFSYDAAYEIGTYKYLENMQATLGEDFICEQCTIWYSAVYKNRN